MERRKILVAEGEPLLRQYYIWELEREGYQAIPASTDQETLEAVRQEHPDLVLLDLRIPAQGGLETLNRILEKADAPPVILTSSGNVWGESFLIWNADACIQKSLDLDELKQAIRKSLLRRSLRGGPLAKTVKEPRALIPGPAALVPGRNGGSGRN
jgi:DNA-binding response OmpR family regulator